MKSIEDIILSKTQYSGDSSANRKALSGSELGSDLRQIWMRQKYGVIKDEKIGQNTLGSILHLGIEKILEDTEGIETEVNIETNLIDGWKLTGSIDIVDTRTNTIYDIKSTKQYTVDKFIKDDNHAYKLQINAYRQMYNEEYDMKILFILKDGGYDFRSMTDKPTILIVDVERIDAISYANSIVRQLKALGSKEPPECKDLWFRKIKDGTSVPMRCMKYCSYNKLCKHYNPHPATIAKMF